MMNKITNRRKTEKETIYLLHVTHEKKTRGSASPDGISVPRSRWSAFLMPEPILDWLASKRMLTAPTLAFYAHTSEEAAGYRIIEYQKSR